MGFRAESRVAGGGMKFLSADDGEIGADDLGIGMISCRFAMEEMIAPCANDR